jgi:putative hemolysin
MIKPILLAVLLVFLSNAMSTEPLTVDKPVTTQTTPAAGTPDPSAVYCNELGYSTANGDCVFLDGTRCPTWHFYRGKCGQEWSLCANRGGRFENRVEDRGTWTAEYGVCVFEVVSECGEQELVDGSCAPGDCARWTSAKGCEPPGAPVPSTTKLPGEWKKHRNAAHYQKGDWNHFLFTKKQGSAESCTQTCWDEPSCSVFFINERGRLVLESLGDMGVFDLKECVFFSGKLWAASAPQSDTYVRVATASSDLEAASPTHCRAEESRVFNCVIEGPEELVLSVCASDPLGDRGGYLQYRFGPRDRVDLEYPERHAGSYEAFEYTRYTRPRTTFLRLGFKVGNYKYSVSQDSAQEGSAAGVRVTMPDGGKTRFRCRDAAEGSLMKLEKHVPNKNWTEVEM